MDNTNLKELESLRQFVEDTKIKLEESERNKQLANVAPSVVHDIRNSLGVISRSTSVCQTFSNVTSGSAAQILRAVATRSGVCSRSADSGTSSVRASECTVRGRTDSRRVKL